MKRYFKSDKRQFLDVEWYVYALVINLKNWTTAKGTYRHWVGTYYYLSVHILLQSVPFLGTKVDIRVAGLYRLLAFMMV